MWAGVFVNERRTLTLWINEEDIASGEVVSECQLYYQP